MEPFVDYGNAVNAFNELEMSYFAGNLYRRMEAMAAGPLISSMIGEVYEHFDDDDDDGAWVRAIVVNGTAKAKFCGRLSNAIVNRYYAGKIKKEFDDDFRRTLDGLKAAPNLKIKENA